jgi:hypothetical protein
MNRHADDHRTYATSENADYCAALNNRLVEMTQPNSPNSPTQKYRFTDKGRALLITLMPK